MEPSATTSISSDPVKESKVSMAWQIIYNGTFGREAEEKARQAILTAFEAAE